ncbi:hypothetical protein [Geodermatophilus sp. SYSU D00815]
MAEPTRGDRIEYRVMCVVGVVCGAGIGAAVFALLAVLALAGLDATVGVTPPDVDRPPDTPGEWVLAAGVLVCGLVGAVIGAREPTRPGSTSEPG